MRTKETCLEMAKTIGQAAIDKKGDNVVVMDVEKVSTLGDYFVFTSANNPKQAQAIADNIEDEMEEKGFVVLHREGYREGEWILLDFGDVIGHVFSGEARHFYGLEEVWSDGTIVPFDGN